ncbi:hypothetical protein LEP1GSC194_1180 [Leptospira alstonii serovar Sichuan str. 79601]|uniref:Uncharacterized protein n=1 Tax=Leptospira alstonii serovar Sichuan str. 79601 TaxID=1218565 RepID=M6CNM0_9LEPT|nr:hypothetical protein LEP1GSC194_1180 [Leptospira alstonii serovar Sichuan str. 79601]
MAVTMETLEFGCGSSILEEEFEIVPLIPFVWRKNNKLSEKTEEIMSA